MRFSASRSLLALAMIFASGVAFMADPPGDPTAVKQDAGRVLARQEGRSDLQDREATARVDFATYTGFRRYHSDCHVCHGPDGEGSSYAPALADSLEDDGLRDLRRHRRQRPQGLPQRQRQRDAVVRRQQKRDLLSQRHLRLSARTLAGRGSARPARQTCAEAGQFQRRRRQMHG